MRTHFLILGFEELGYCSFLRVLYSGEASSCELNGTRGISLAHAANQILMPETTYAFQGSLSASVFR